MTIPTTPEQAPAPRASGAEPETRWIVGVSASISFVVEGRTEDDALARAERVVRQYLDTPLVFRIPGEDFGVEILFQDDTAVEDSAEPDDAEWKRLDPRVWPRQPLGISVLPWQAQTDEEIDQLVRQRALQALRSAEEVELRSPLHLYRVGIARGLWSVSVYSRTRKHGGALAVFPHHGARGLLDFRA